MPIPILRLRWTLALFWLTAIIPYIEGTSETIECISPPYKICVAHKLITTLQWLLTNFKGKDRPEDRQGAVYKINTVTARPLKLVRPAETLTCDWLNTRKQQEMVMSTILLLHTIHRRNVKLTGTPWHA